LVILLLAILFVLLALSVPIAVALGLATSIIILIDGRTPMNLLPQITFNSINSFPLMAIPFFVMAGTIMEFGGISKRIIRVANLLVGNVAGGLGIVAVVASMLFASISGSGIATTAALGSILIPSMIKKGYDRGFAGALQAVSGELGAIIPPSISMIVYGVAGGVSIGSMFIAGFLPGFLIGISLIIGVYIIAKIRGYQGETEKLTFREKVRVVLDAVPALFMAVIILGGIYGGIFTPTEASAIATAYALIIAFFVYKEMGLKDLLPAFAQSMITSSIVLFIVMNAGFFSHYLAHENVPRIVTGFFVDKFDSSFMFLLVINIVLLITGMFLDGVTAMILLAPILVPVAVSLGIDPVHFGIVMVVNLAIGMCTPPVGVNLFVASDIAKVSLEYISRKLLPLLIILIADLMLISYLPDISLFLVRLLQ